jgi:hypothetical protein
MTRFFLSFVEMSSKECACVWRPIDDFYFLVFFGVFLERFSVVRLWDRIEIGDFFDDADDDDLFRWFLGLNHFLMV